MTDEDGVTLKDSNEIIPPNVCSVCENPITLGDRYIEIKINLGARRVSSDGDTPGLHVVRQSGTEHIHLHHTLYASMGSW